MDGWNNAKVLITGGAGFIGSHLADSLLRLGVQEIRIIDDLSRGRLENLGVALSSGRVVFHRGDIREIEKISSLAQGCDYAFHLAAWRIHRCETNPAEALEVMVQGTQNVLEACARAGVKKIIYASSASVYGQASTFPTPESHPPYGNDTLYGWAKLLGEGLVQWYVKHQRFSGICLRFFNVYGPRMDLEGKYTEVMIRWIEAVLNDKRPILHGDGSAKYDFVHVRDVVRACILAAESEQKWGVYNVGTGTECSLLELAKLIIAVLGRENIEPQLLPEHLPLVWRRCACLKAITRDLGYTPTVRLPDGVRDLAQWYLRTKDRKIQTGSQDHGS